MRGIVSSEIQRRIACWKSTNISEATCSSETSVNFQRTTRRYILEDRTLHNHRCENLKSYTITCQLQTVILPYIFTLNKYLNVECRLYFTETLRVVFLMYTCRSRPPLWSSGQSSWLQIQRFRVRFPALSDFLRRNGSGKGSTQRREDN
jgi:hypothetical protein